MGALEDGRFVLETPAIAIGGKGGDLATGTIEDHVRVLLKGLGEDPEREGLRKTPMRVAKAFRDGTRGYTQKVKDIVQDALFPEAGLDDGTGQAGGAGGLVVVRDINLFSFCESCLLPFSIQCHVGYVPSGKRVVGLSKLSRVADMYAKRLQEPKRLADEVCWALQNSINPSGVSVALQCWHIRFPEVFKCNPNPSHPSRSTMQGWVRTTVCSSTGIFNDKNSSLWDEFHGLLKLRGINLSDAGCSSIHSWCPSMSLDLTECHGNISRSNFPIGKVSSQSAMVAAVSSILQSLGEDLSRKELFGTPYRYVHWLMNFRRSNLDFKQTKFTINSAHSYEKVNGYIHSRDEIHSELNFPFCAQCEHHLLPFHGVVHIGFFHDGPIDRSALQSIVHFYACKLQVQERLTRQIAEAVYSFLAKGVMVVVEANHICMISRGIEKVGSSTATMAMMGQFSTDSTAKALVLEAISMSTATGG
ncbi:hypothetical protein KFK09_002065 [Dendrobium nobile]|uniref:GTP cyclohydrolase 1 n=1 Tax=Dendrobium nobile TaxID=94219 RepID=A0A8T3C6W0_DENNO|nr:hypothetical protein KFK09_002065 [Dendrobium nobile]